MSTFHGLTRDVPSDTIQDITQYNEAKNTLMFQLTPNCNEMTLKREYAAITPETGEEPAAFLSRLANAVTKVHSKLKAMKAEISTDEQPIVVHQAVPEAVTLQSSTSPPMNKCFDCCRSHDHPMDR
uniref:Uncharacterized protein n=1 Tax=Romanomermis culicivorax TaxID=13658 RepID=A0A915HFA6_ROMCU